MLFVLYRDGWDNNYSATGRSMSRRVDYFAARPVSPCMFVTSVFPVILRSEILNSILPQFSMHYIDEAQSFISIEKHPE
jgi:uncharacterized membrane protein